MSHVAGLPRVPASTPGSRPEPVPSASPTASPVSGASGRLGGGAFVVLTAIVGLVIAAATDQIVPASSPRQAELRIWLASRAAGFMSFGLLTAQVVLGLVLSHPTNKATWRLSRRLFPWHENAWVFVMAFLAVHVVTIVADRYAHVGLIGALVPGLSEYRSPAVALGTIGLYALLVTGLSARYTRRLPAGWWLKLHRVAIVVWAVTWVHGVLSGSDSIQLAWTYGVAFALVVGAAAYRYWVGRRGRPTFSSSLSEVTTR